MSTNDSPDFQTIKQDNQRLKKDAAELKSQVEELKKELRCLEKKLKKAEYEKDNAEGHVQNLKRDLDSVRKEFYEEKQKWKQEREALIDASQSKHVQTLSHEISSKDEDGQEKDIKTVLEEAASQAIAKSGLVYDENSGLYFDWSCGLYYDPNSCLYYNNITGTYYYFNEESNSYEFHSQIELPAESTDEQYKTKKKKKKVTPKAKKKRKVIEIKSSSGENDSSSGEIISSDDESDDTDTDDDDDDNNVHHTVAPCIRAIVTNSDKLKIGTLFIVTCTGGSLGREKDVGHAIIIPDVAVSKYHCKFAYDQERRQYFICDLGSRNGTLLNDKQFGQIGKESEPQVLTHGDSLTVGGTTLSMHIHQATETCDECEPGLMQTKVEDTGHYQVSSQGNSENQRKKQLKNLKKAYGLEQEAYTEGSDVLDKQKYRDRADLRRVKVGSDVPNQPDAAPSSVHRPISSDNKGRKMLEKMGWKDGEGLGKESTGLKEPVLATVHEQSRGIGFGVKRSIDLTNAANPSSKMLTKTRERYEDIFKSNTMESKQRRTLFVPQVNKKDEDKSEIT